MTKIIIDLENIKDINSYLVDGFIINIKNFSTYNGCNFSIDNLIEIINLVKINNKQVFLNTDRLFSEDDLDQLYELFKVIDNIEYDYLIFSDFSVYYYFNKKNMLNKLIYDAKTMGTNIDDINFFKDRNVMVFVANELSKEQIKILSETNNTCMEVFGYHQIFYSKRPILSLFNEFENLNISLKNTLLEIKEISRDSYYKIYESDLGTFVYTDYIYCAYDDIKVFVNNFKYIKINPIFLNNKNMMEIISYYRDLIKNKNITENELLIKKSFPNVKSGFLIKKSVLLKEDTHEEN